MTKMGRFVLLFVLKEENSYLHFPHRLCGLHTARGHGNPPPPPAPSIAALLCVMASHGTTVYGHIIHTYQQCEHAGFLDEKNCVSPQWSEAWL